MTVISAVYSRYHGRTALLLKKKKGWLSLLFLLFSTTPSPLPFLFLPSLVSTCIIKPLSSPSSLVSHGTNRCFLRSCCCCTAAVQRVAKPPSVRARRGRSVAWGRCLCCGSPERLLPSCCCCKLRIHRYMRGNTHTILSPSCVIPATWEAAGDNLTPFELQEGKMTRIKGRGGFLTMFLFLSLIWTQLLITGKRLLSVCCL